MSQLKWIVPAVIVLGGFMICTTASYGKAEYTKATKKTCLYCHQKNEPANKEAMSKNLTDAGKYYKDHKSLDGYTEKK